MKVIVAGCRDYNNYEFVKKELDKLITKDDIIISGMANGVDSLAVRYAKENNINLEEYPADWNKHGKSAGPIRNAEMAKAGDKLIAFWDGKSKGTKNMIDTAKKKNLSVHITTIS